MTDTTMGGRGGVGIRLFVEGGEVVKRTFGQIADSGKRMWTEIAAGEQSANPAMVGLSRTSQGAQQGMEALGARAGTAGIALQGFGAIGVATAAGLGALVLALNQARAAMDWADEIADSAQKINIGVEALQEWRFVAVDAGGDARDAGAAIDGFQKKLGEALAGGRAAKWFERLGFSKDDLEAFSSTEEALDTVIGRVAALGTEAERAAVADKLGLGPLTAAIREGSDAIDDMRARARELGVVMEAETIQRAADAQREMEVLSQVIDLQLKQSFIELGPVLVDLLKLVAEFTGAIAALAESWKAFDLKSSSYLRREDQRLSEGITQLLRRAGADSPADLSPSERTVFERLNARRGRIAQEMADRAASRPAPSTPGGTRLIDIDTPRSRGGGGRGNDAAREAERRAREQERLLEQLARMETTAERSWFQTMYGPGGPRESRLELALAQVAMDREAWVAQRDALAAELEKVGLLDEANKARLEELDALQVEASRARDAAALREEERRLAAERLDAERASDEHAIDLLAIDEQLAANARDRTAIARRILELQQALERKLLAADLEADETLSPEERARRLGLTDERHRRELGLFDHQERERLREDFRSYGREVVDAIEAGRIGEHIGDELKARLIDMALNGLFDVFGPRGGGKGGGGSLLDMGARLVGSLFGMGPGRAGGGDLWKGYRHPVVETGRPELLLIGGRGQVTGAEETARLLRDMAGAGPAGANGGRMAGGAEDGGFEVTVRAADGLRAEVRRVSREEARDAAATAGARSYRASVTAAPQAVADRRAYRE